MLPSYLHNNVFSAPNWTFVHGFCVLVPNYVANHVVFWSNFCRESRCFGDTFRPLKKLLVTQKGFFAGLNKNININIDSYPISMAISIVPNIVDIEIDISLTPVGGSAFLFLSNLNRQDFHL